MLELRAYQHAAIDATLELWQRVRAVLIVCPTGGGKSICAEALIRDARARGQRVIAIAHRTVLVNQLAARFSAIEPVGRIDGEHEPELDRPIQVATIQSLMARGTRPPADLFLYDEAHHLLSSDWRTVLDAYSSARWVGLTATPERAQGEAMGDVFDELVVAARYPELVRDGFLVECNVIQPNKILDSGLAIRVVDAYTRYAQGSRAFIFCRSVEECYAVRADLLMSGVKTEVIEADTPTRERNQSIAAFEAGKVRALCSVATLTEGVDIPSARTCILACLPQHASGYLQRVGRVLRPHPEKPHAILIDLTGATLLHGMPTEDREYSLTGVAIRRTSEAPLRVCPKCGVTCLSAQRTCPECGHTITVEQQYGVKIWNAELREVYAGAETPKDAKRREYKRLRDWQRARGLPLQAVVREFRKLFGESPLINDATESEKHAELARLRMIAQSKGYKRGFVFVRYKALFGVAPRF